MVQTKADRERQKLITDKCQALIEVLLRDEDNKYCVDCDAKGPRWASWNLGIFLCIRCAGIHRNLGVHISRVKSVNLDAWTPDHVAYVQRMGNSRARAIYEANLPDDFRRPQTDTALESFIRAKYEHKRYIDQAYVDPGPPAPAFNADEELRRMKEQKRSKLNSGSNKTMITVSDSFAPAASATATSQQVSSTTTSNSSKSRPSAGSSLSQQPSLLFGAESFPQPASSVSTSGGQTTNTTDNSNANPISRPKSNLADLMDLDLGFGASNLAPISSNTSSSNTMTNPLANFDAFSGLNTSLGASSANATFNSGISSATNTTTTTVTNINNNNFNSNSFSFDATPPTVNSNQPIAGSAGKNVFDLLDI